MNQPPSDMKIVNLRLDVRNTLFGRHSGESQANFVLAFVHTHAGETMIEFVTSPISDSAILVQLGGDLRESSRSYFFDCMGDLIDSGISDIVIECNKLGFISSSGLAALLLARRKATKKGCRIYFTHVGSTLADLLEVTNLGQFFSVYATTEEAIAKFDDKSAIEDTGLQPDV